MSEDEPGRSAGEGLKCPLGKAPLAPAWSLLELALGSRAALAITPMQDVVS